MQEMRFLIPFSSFLSSSSSFPFFMLWDPHPRGKNSTGQREKLARTTACPRGALRVGGSAEVAPVLAVILCVNRSLDVGALGTEV